MKRRISLLLILLLMILGRAGNSFARTFYVDFESGSDNAEGTSTCRILEACSG